VSIGIFNLHQDFVASMDNDLFHRQNDGGLIYSGETWMFNQEGEDKTDVFSSFSLPVPVAGFEPSIIGF
jgi:hypothetical protein